MTLDLSARARLVITGADGGNPHELNLQKPAIAGIDFNLLGPRKYAATLKPA